MEESRAAHKNVHRVHLKFITFSSRQIEVHLASTAISLARPQNE